MKACYHYIFILTISLWSCTKDHVEVLPSSQGAVVTLVFDHMSGDKPLVLNTGKNLNFLGDTFTVQHFKYYISNVILSDTGGQPGYVEKNSYHLINQEGKLSFTMDSISAGYYKNLQFSIGVDSSHNHNIDFTGDLDPNNDMSWGWTSGYKFLLLEGTFATTTSTGVLVFHIGNDKNYKTITLSLPGNQLYIDNGSVTTIHIKTDVNAMFDAPNPIDFSITNQVMDDNADAKKLVANYAQGMFSISSIYIQTSN